MALPKINRLLIARHGGRFIAGRDFQVATLQASAGLSAFAALPPVQAFMDGQAGYRGPFYRLFGYAETGAASVKMSRPGATLEARATLSVKGAFIVMKPNPMTIQGQANLKQLKPTTYDWVKPTERWEMRADLKPITGAAYLGPSSAQGISGLAAVQPVTKFKYTGPSATLKGYATVLVLGVKMNAIASVPPITGAGNVVLKQAPKYTPMTVEKFNPEAMVLVSGLTYTYVVRSTLKLTGEARVAPVTAKIEGFGVDIRAWADLPPSYSEVTLRFGGQVNITGEARTSFMAEGGVKLIGMPELIQATAAMVGNPTAKAVGNAQISASALCAGYPPNKIVATPSAIQATANVTVSGVKLVTVLTSSAAIQATAGIRVVIEENPPFYTDLRQWMLADTFQVAVDGVGKVSRWTNKKNAAEWFTPSSTNPPLYEPEGFYGLGAVSWPGAENPLRLNAAWGSGSPITVVVLGSDIKGGGMVFGQYVNTSTFVQEFSVDTNLKPNLYAAVTQINGSDLTYTVSSGTSQPALGDGVNTLFFSRGGSLFTIGHNGVQTGQLSQSAAARSASITSMGDEYNSNPKMRMHQMLVYGRQLTLAEIQQVEAWMLRRLDQFSERSSASIKASANLTTTTDVRVVAPGGFSPAKVLNSQYITLSEANRRVRGAGGYGIIRSVKFNSPGAKWYAEFDVIDSTGTNAPTLNIGWYSSDTDTSVAGQFALNRNSSGLWACTGGTVTYAGAQVAIAAGQVIGLAVDATTEPYTWKVYLNGVLYASGNGVAKGTDTLLGVLFTNGNSGFDAEVRFRRDVLYRPTGYQHWDNEDTDITA